MADEQLKPCPFCGGKALQIIRGSPGCEYVKCEGCKATTDDTSRLRAITAWNRRAPADDSAVVEVLRAENERLREALDVAWKKAHEMRNASKLVGPYPNDRAATRTWARSLYHAGKDLCELLKPFRAITGGSNEAK